MRNSYTVTYEGAAMNGVSGFWYRITVRGRLVAEGWTAGRKHHAEADHRQRGLGDELRHRLIPLRSTRFFHAAIGHQIPVNSATQHIAAIT